MSRKPQITLSFEVSPLKAVNEGEMGADETATNNSEALELPATTVTPRRTTLRYGAKISGQEGEQGSVPSIKVEDAVESAENTRQALKEMEEAVKPAGVPDLRELFSNNGSELIDGNPLFEPVCTVTKEAVLLQVGTTGNDNALASTSLFEEECATPRAEVVTIPQKERGFISSSDLESAYCSEPKIPPKPLEETGEMVLDSVMLSPEVISDLARHPMTRAKPPQPKLKKTVEQPENQDTTVDNEGLNRAKSWFKNIASTLSTKWGAVKNSVKDFLTRTTEKVTDVWKGAKKLFRRHAKPLALAAGVALSAGSNSTPVINSTQNAQSTIQTPEVEAASTADLTIEEDASETGVVEQKVEKTRTFAKILTDSKSPVVQDILKKGEIKLGNHTVTDSMINPFMGLANAKQKAQLHELQNYINLGLGVYFNEYFGTPEKVAKSLKDPKLRNLYRTAKVAQEKGWFQSYHTKERFPKAYQLAVRMLEDSSVLGLDESSNPNTRVQDFVRGNMFQAKLPGELIKVRKTDGNYHVVQEMVLQIFEGKSVSELLDTNAGKEVKADQEGHETAPVKKVIEPVSNDATGQILPNIHFQNGVQLNNLDRQLADLGLDESGWDQIVVDQEKTQTERLAFEKSLEVEFELPLSLTTRQENAEVVPAAANKIAKLYPEADEQKIIRLIRQYGFIGLSLISRDRGHFRVQLNKNFYKILKTVLNQKQAKIS